MKWSSNLDSVKSYAQKWFWRLVKSITWEQLTA